MSKISSSKLHRNDNSSSAFAVCILSLLDWVRTNIAYLNKSRKADEHAPGSIHALRKLCEGESEMWQVGTHLHRSEIQEWHDIFFAWFKRVQRWIPAELRDDFKLNAEDDFRVLLELAGKAPESQWRKKSLERRIKLSFETEEALEDARNLADEKFPVQLGSALHEYLYSAIGRLQGFESREPDIVTVSNPRPLISIDRDASGEFSVIVGDFALFHDTELTEQEVDFTAYDIEECILGLSETAVVPPESFDCESSTFIFRSSNEHAVTLVVKHLVDLLGNDEFRAAHLHKKA